MAPRSAKVKAKAIIASVVNDSSEDEYSTEYEVEEVGHSASIRRRSTAAPARKKARTSAANRTQPSDSNTLGSLLETMPLDIHYEIFGHLQSKDLVSLLRTSKLFRATLMTKNVISVWRRARRDSVLPDCPSDRSEPAWAVLFYSNTCEECGGKNVQHVDFLFRRRLCKSCRKNIFIESRFKSLYRGVDPSILELVCYSDSRSGSRRCGGPFKGPIRYFWPPDVDDMIHTLTAFQNGIKRGQSGAEKRLHIFKEERKKLITYIHSTAGANESCLEDIIDERRQEECARNMESYALNKKRRSAISEQLMLLGYTEKDIYSVRDCREFATKVQLTDNIWRRIRPILEAAIAEKRRIKAEEDLANAKCTRRQIVDTFYVTYKKSLRPSQCHYLPRTCDLCDFEPFSPLINAPSDANISVTDFEPFFRILPEILASYAQCKLRHFRGLLSAGSNRKDAATDVYQLEGSTGMSWHDIDPLKFATSVFECRGWSDSYSNRHGGRFVLVGLDDLLSHQCLLRDEGLRSRYFSDKSISKVRIDFVPAGAEVARSLIRLAGFDPRTALASEMDEANLRFGCNHCLPQSKWDWGKQITFCVGYNWRAAIIHGLRGYHKGMSSSVVNEPWAVLSQDDTSSVKEKEKKIYERYHYSPRWTCDHCWEYMHNEDKRPTIIQHLHDKHGLTDPKEPEDLLFVSQDDLLLEEYTYHLPLPVKASH
ncbi:hypothetical protein GALMADRAFT_255180 [Galerina marginata CBS 339.88]|uniref:F-box domain-containing protein n=1 Tax=Galerina marginata (strain CBS 339.88) TaxID=685588 RepID=A0A067SJS0_GALM3|nr:hypothetical protein GALMADRAFT_255180 [Galerina marginata CBS 339.88]